MIGSADHPVQQGREPREAAPEGHPVANT